MTRALLTIRLSRIHVYRLVKQSPSAMYSNVLVERSFENEDDEKGAQAEGSKEPKEEIKIPEPTLEPDLQTFCKLIFDSE